MNELQGLVSQDDLEDLSSGPHSIDLVSTEDNPQLATEMSQAALESEMPLMEDAPSGQVELPGGWISPEGNLHTDALVAELTGRAEEKLARIDPMSNAPLFFSTMLEFGVESIGGVKPTREMLRDLLVGDRESLILGIRVATYGNEVPQHIRCPNCGAEEEIAIELDKDIPVKKMAQPSVREYEVPLRKGSVAKVTPLTCGMQDDVWDSKKSVAEAKTVTLQRCIVSIDGRPVTYEGVLNLGMGDRKTLLDFLADLQPGPNYEGVRLPCESCGEEFLVRLDLTDLFP